MAGLPAVGRRKDFADSDNPSQRDGLQFWFVALILRLLRLLKAWPSLRVRCTAAVPISVAFLTGKTIFFGTEEAAGRRSNEPGARLVPSMGWWKDSVSPPGGCCAINRRESKASEEGVWRAAGFVIGIPGGIGMNRCSLAMRLKLTIAYDGAAFKGWQSQPFGTTVQDVLEDALKRITGERVVVHGAGRTDAGVHALGQVAHIEVPERFPAEEWQRILNFNLPPAIRIARCRRARRDFHARHSARGKIYRYLIRNQDVVLPHEAGRVWRVPEKLDPAVLRAAAGIFVGRHDFRGFGANKSSPGNTVRTISRIRVGKKGSLIALTFEGEGFLYRMVRMLTGSIVRVAQGRDELAQIERRLHGPGRPMWNHAAPAGGLHLIKVLYGSRS